MVRVRKMVISLRFRVRHLLDLQQVEVLLTAFWPFLTVINPHSNVCTLFKHNAVSSFIQGGC